MNECIFPIEILTVISNYIQEGSTWKAFTQTCKSVYKLNTIVVINKYSNHLTTLLNTYPDWKWDVFGLSGNPNLFWSFVEAHRNWCWHMDELSGNPNLPWSFVEAHREWKWDIV